MSPIEVHIDFLQRPSRPLPLVTESQLDPGCPSYFQDTAGPLGPVSHPVSYGGSTVNHGLC